jgi:hypothetical protein
MRVTQGAGVDAGVVGAAHTAPPTKADAEAGTTGVAVTNAAMTATERSVTGGVGGETERRGVQVGQEAFNGGRSKGDSVEVVSKERYARSRSSCARCAAREKRRSSRRSL